LNLGSVDSEEIAGFVLAGGESRRMGRDKALTVLAGKPLIEHALGILRDAGLEARIAGARSDLSRFAPVVADAEPGRGPLGGICAAFAACPAKRIVFLPVDLPLLPASLITFLVHRTLVTTVPVTIVLVTGFRQSFPVVIDRAALPSLQLSLERGAGGCFAAFEKAAANLGHQVSGVPVEYAAQAGQLAHPAGLPPAFWFLNANTPQDLLRAEALLGRRVA
jgi:molybdopterin-guanine dinucleotide biosynthesis protein A